MACIHWGGPEEGEGNAAHHKPQSPMTVLCPLLTLHLSPAFKDPADWVLVEWPVLLLMMSLPLCWAALNIIDTITTPHFSSFMVSVTILG